MMILMIVFLFNIFVFNIQADTNKSIQIIEHKKTNNSLEQTGKILSEKILIRVPRMYHNRQRRDYYETKEQIWGMAKRVFITVIILISVCVICCIVTIIYLFIRCCCGRDDYRKRNQGFNTIPQPVIIHTNSPGYVPQPYQQQAPPFPLQQPSTSMPMWQLENHPMLPQPSAPPQAFEELYPDRPPSYEKAIAN